MAAVDAANINANRVFFTLSLWLNFSVDASILRDFRTPSNRSCNYLLGLILTMPPLGFEFI